MNGNTTKIGALLAVFALFASLLVSIPVGAAPTPDIYIKSVGVPATAPTIGDNITVTATIRAVNATACKNVTVNFYAVNGTSSTAISTILVAGPVKNTGDWIVNGSWNSTTVIPNGDLVYTIKAVASIAGETNLTNNTKNSTLTIDWMAPKLQAFGMTGDATALIGDMYTGTVSVKNIGDANFVKVQAMNVMEGSDILDTIQVNGTVTAIAAGAVKVYDYEVNTTTWVAADAGEHNFTFGYGGEDFFVVVDFAVKATNVYVTGVTFTPASGMKGLQAVTINATLLNMGTKDAVDMPVHFWYNTSAAQTPVEITSTPAVTVNVSKDNSTVTTTGIVWAIPTSTIDVVYTINVTVDQAYKTKIMTVLPTPHVHLGISSIAFNPTALVAKANTGDLQNLTITVTVANTGDKAAVNAVVTFMLSGATTPLFTNNSVNISIGGSTEVSYTYAVPTPKDAAILNFTIGVTLGTATASDWKNISVPGHIYKSVLEFTELTASPATQVEAGLPVTFSVTVKNTGDLLAAKVDLTFLAGTTTIGTKSLYNLTVGGAGNTTSVTWTPTTVAKVNINVTISATNYKNITYSVIATKKPVLVVDFAKDAKGKVKSYSSSAADGKTKTLKVVVTLQNTGTADAKNVNVTLTDSKGKALGSGLVPTVVAGQSTTVTIAIKLKAGASTKLTATAVYDGIHALAGIDKGLTATSPAATAPTAKVVKTPGFEGVVLAAAVAVALVVLSRRKKN
jgi:hypothetical protein